jgi:hypothetical protein
MSTTFEIFVKYLLHKVLIEDFAVASFDIILIHQLDEDYETANIKFTNAQRILASTDIFKDVLFNRVAQSLFAYYIEARKKTEIRDEPEDCTALIIFRNNVYESTWFWPIFDAYFDKVIIPVFNTRISNALASLFGDDF